MITSANSNWVKCDSGFYHRVKFYNTLSGGELHRIEKQHQKKIQ